MDLSSGSGMTLVVLLCFMITQFYVLPIAEAVWLTIPSSGTKCVSEEIQTNVVVLADYYVITDDVPQLLPVSVRVCFINLPNPHSILFYFS